MRIDRARLLGATIAAVALGLPAGAAAHPAVYDVTKKVAPGAVNGPTPVAA